MADCNNVGTAKVTGATITLEATKEQLAYEISHIDKLYGGCPDKLVISIVSILINIIINLFP